MPVKVKVVLDSLSDRGIRLTTLELTYPRIVHQEVLTHRDRARNSASSRAIPWTKMRQQIEGDPFVPFEFGVEQRGMQAGSEIVERAQAEEIWLKARDHAVQSAQELADLGVHKSICNRLTEPFMYITVLMTATEWANFFRLRCHADAEIHFRTLACTMRDTLANSTPQLVKSGDWHIPFIQPDEQTLPLDTRLKVSTARCARVSYLTHEGQRSLDKDLDLYERLLRGSDFGHWSAFEHLAQANAQAAERSGPFRGWVQYRKFFENENVVG